MRDDNKVFILGVWDLFHQGHLNIIEKASMLGPLFVGVVCDEAVRRVKGKDKPVICEKERRNIVSALKSVTSTELLKDFTIPHEFLKGRFFILIGEDQDHITNKDQIDPMWRFNYSRTPGISTSDIIRKIKGE